MKKLLLLICISYAMDSSGQSCVPNTNSLLFDGTSSYVSMPTNTALDISDSITIEAWINSNAWGFTSAQNTIVCKHGWYFGEEGYVLRAGGTGELSFNIAGTNGIVQWVDVISSTGALQLNTWYHVAGSFDGANLRVYINGSLAGTTPFTGTIVPSTDHSLNIGRLADMNQPETRFFSGMIDEVRIWHRALDATELTANMSKHIDPLTAQNLVAYWRMNEGTGTTLSDLGTGSTTGTLLNTTWSTDVPFTEGPAVPLVTPSSGYLVSSAITGNQWNFNGVPILNEMGTTLLPTQDGSYTVTVTDLSGCSATSAPFIITGVGAVKSEVGFPIKFYSGADRILHFVSTTDAIERSELRLIDINGKTVSIKPAGIQKEAMDMSTLSNGVYVLHAVLGNSEYRTKIVLR